MEEYLYRGERDKAEDLGMEREGDEEYGHMVELGDNGNAPPAGEPAGGTNIAVAEEGVKEESREEFISDPLVKCSAEEEKKELESRREEVQNQVQRFLKAAKELNRDTRSTQ